MRAYVRFRLPDGSSCTLGHGDLVGRLATAGLRLADPRISEAHAMVSLRGSDLKLLGLRGRFAVDGKPVSEVRLVEGLEIQLARGLPIVCEEVELPDQVLAIEAEDVPRQVLSGTSSIVLKPRPRLIPRYQGDASAWLWTEEDGWRLALRDQDARPLEPGDSFEVGGVDFRAVGVALDHASHSVTRFRDAIHRPLRIEARFETVHLHREETDLVVLTGLAAKIVSELASFGCPVQWEMVAQPLWPDLSERELLRRRWDVALARLRRKLREGRVRTDLVHADRGGNVELLLREGDQVLDRT